MRGVWHLALGAALIGASSCKKADWEAPDAEVVWDCEQPSIKKGYLRLTAESAASDIKSFCAQGYTGLTGSLLVQGAQSLRGLGCLCTVGAGVTIADSELTSLDGLESLIQVDGPIDISRNEHLERIDGLGTFGDFDEDITIVSNPKIRSLDGLEGLTRALRVQIEGNRSLVDASGLEGLATAQELLLIDSPIERLDLSNLTEVAGDFALVGLDLAYLDLSALEHVDGSLKLWRNTQALTDGATPPPITVGGSLVIKENQGLTSLDAFPCPTSVAYNLHVLDNARLTTLDGLSCLGSIGGVENLLLHGNASLVDLTPLYGISGVHEELIITDNRRLDPADAYALLEAIGYVQKATIHGNGS